MRGLLIVLCAIVTGAAALAGGCALLITGVGAAVAPGQNQLLGLLATTAPVIVVAAAVAIVNIGLISAIAAGRAPRRTMWFSLLAVVDLAVAAILVVGGFAGQGPVNPGDASTLFLPVMLAIKGGLTLLLPAQPSPLPPGENPEKAA